MVLKMFNAMKIIKIFSFEHVIMTEKNSVPSGN